MTKTPEQNGVAEGMNRTLVETIRAMLADSQLQKRFFLAEALSTATYLRSLSATRAVQGIWPYKKDELKTCHINFGQDPSQM